MSSVTISTTLCGLPAVFFEGRRVDVDLDLARESSLQEVPVRESGGVEVEFAEIPGCGVGVVRTNRSRSLACAWQPPDVRDRLLDERFCFLRLRPPSGPFAVRLREV